MPGEDATVKETTQAYILRLDGKDTVGVAIKDLVRGGDYLVVGTEQHVAPLANIPFGHKIALDDIPQDGLIVKYGETIGYARCDLAAGSHVHTHNMRNTIG